MTAQVSADDIERIVGARRHPILHRARAVSAEQTVYILHSIACLNGYDDLRKCPYSLALDRGIELDDWTEDEALDVGIAEGRLCPLNERGVPV